MNEPNLISRVNSTLPVLREWVEKTLEENRPSAVPLISLNLPRINKVFPHDLLNRTHVVAVTGKVPIPPLSHMGLSKFSQIESLPIEGAAYKDTFFVSHLHQTESLYFHELVHVIQWERLGVDNFIISFGVCLAQSGYRNNPFEKMAHSLQAYFDLGIFFANTVELVQRRTDAIWSGVAPLLSEA